MDTPKSNPVDQLENLNEHSSSSSEQEHVGNGDQMAPESKKIEQKEGPLKRAKHQVEQDSGYEKTGHKKRELLSPGAKLAEGGSPPTFSVEEESRNENKLPMSGGKKEEEKQSSTPFDKVEDSDNNDKEPLEHKEMNLESSAEVEKAQFVESGSTLSLVGNVEEHEEIAEMKQNEMEGDSACDQDEQAETDKLIKLTQNKADGVNNSMQQELPQNAEIQLSPTNLAIVEERPENEEQANDPSLLDHDETSKDTQVEDVVTNIVVGAVTSISNEDQQQLGQTAESTVLEDSHMGEDSFMADLNNTDEVVVEDVTEEVKLSDSNYIFIQENFVPEGDVTYVYETLEDEEEIVDFNVASPEEDIESDIECTADDPFVLIKGQSKSIDYCPGCETQLDPIKGGYSINFTTFEVKVKCISCLKDVIIKESFSEKDKSVLLSR